MIIWILYFIYYRAYQMMFRFPANANDIRAVSTVDSYCSYLFLEGEIQNVTKVQICIAGLYRNCIFCATFIYRKTIPLSFTSFP